MLHDDFGNRKNPIVARQRKSLNAADGCIPCGQNLAVVLDCQTVRNVGLTSERRGDSSNTPETGVTTAIGFEPPQSKICLRPDRCISEAKPESA